MIGTITVIATLVALGIFLKKISLRWFYVALKTSKRDLLALSAYIRLLLLVRKHRKKDSSIYEIFKENFKKHPEKIALISSNSDRNLTFAELHELSCRIAYVFHTSGFRKGDVVALYLENCPEFVAIWLGLSRIGCITSLINTNLRNTSLLHCIKIANCKGIIYSESFEESILGIKNNLIDDQLNFFKYSIKADSKIKNQTDLLNKDKANNKGSEFFDLLSLLQNPLNKNDYTLIDSLKPKSNHHDKLLYIYTSGTTGLPKAAIISHARYLFICAGIHYTLNMKDDDIFYTPLPLYHTAGGVMSIGQALCFGSTVVIRDKFSASKYFSDCIKYQCTVSQYIGEMCRYVLSTPCLDSIDKGHKIRLIFGNGLRPQIWPQFVERFNIPRVGEFYGATEGNANISNTDGTVGAIGFVSRIIPSIYPITIIRANPDTGEPIRNENGLCDVCKPDEPGVFIGKIIPGNPSREFLGYVDKQASEKKVIHNVFRKGDSAFCSGDVLIADELGYLYFKDRTGDTFRWKGENCSTSEIEAQISNISNYRDVVVYGVEIPNTEGRAGMAAIMDPNFEIDIINFSKSIKETLPSYARPIFLRFLTKVDLTGTFKLRKIDLQKEGYNPDIIKDKLFYLANDGLYKLLTKDFYMQIQNNKVRF